MNKYLAFSLSIVGLIFLLACSNISSEPPSISTSQTEPPHVFSPPETIPVASTIVEETPTPFQDPAPTIDLTSDGRVLHTNLVKFVGAVPSPGATLTVNHIPAAIGDDGNFEALLDLVPGPNQIEVDTTSGGITRTVTITVTFTPPLVVELNFPQWDNDSQIDYSQTPVKFTGWVSNPQARVTVGGEFVEVSSDGSFRAYRIAGIVRAEATLEDEKDTSLVGLFLSGGKIGIVPGINGVDRSMEKHPDSVDVHPGQIVKLTNTLLNRKEHEPGSLISYEVIRINPELVGIGSDTVIADTAPPLSNLTVSISPETFKIYPNVAYYPTITVRADSTIAPGEYHFLIVTRYGGRIGTTSPLDVKISLAR